MNIATRLRMINPKAAAGSDPHFANVSLLLHMDGTDGSKTFVDSSSNKLPLTTQGNAQISTAQSKFGQAGSFPGAGDYLTQTNSSLFAFGTGDFTVEGWFYFNALPATGTSAICNVANTINTTTPNQWFFRIQDQKAQFGFHYSASPLVASASTVQSQVWYHIAATREAGKLRIFINGTLEGTTDNATEIKTGVLQIGLNATPLWLNGYIDELRITKGVARYTANFTVPTGPFPDH